MMEQASSPQFNGSFGFGAPSTLSGSQRFNYASSMQQQNNNYQNDDFQNTLKSTKSHVTTEAHSLANVSDPNSGGSSQATAGDRVCGSDSVNKQLTTSNSPVAPQHNYSNIQHPIPRPVNSNGGSLTSSRTQSSNASPAMAASPVVPSHGPPNIPPPPIPTSDERDSNPQQQILIPQVSTANSGSIRSRTPIEERIRVANFAEEVKKSKLADVQDLIHLQPPLSEDIVLRTLQARYFNRNYFTNVGPTVLSVNSYANVGNPLTLQSTKEASDNCPELKKVAEEAIRLQNESGYPQAIIVSGISGSGKTHASMILLRQLFNLAEGQGMSEASDTFKHLSAAFTVLRSLSSAQTATNKESSRIGHFIEVQVTDNVLNRTKIHCYFLDQGRVVKPPPTEKSYHIFYQMMAGLHPDERSQLGLSHFAVKDLNYLNMGDTRHDEMEDAERFEQWRNSLAVLGIPSMDVIRVLSAILLLGNVRFTPSVGDDFEVEVIGREELHSTAKLLGISPTILIQGLTTRTHSVRGQPINSLTDSHQCNATRDALAKALYCRTVATIVRRANSFRRPPTGTMGSESTESHMAMEVASHHASTIGTSNSRKSNRSMQILNQALRHATDGFIGILDMFGFEDSKPSQLEQLCINLSSETMQHFYNTHIFKSSIESCREEGIASDVIIDYIDNVPCIDLISSLRTGLLSMLDVECSVRGLPATYVQKVKVQHRDNRKLFEPKHCDLSRTFGIHHYAGSVVYDSSQFLETNRDVISDDIISVFSREHCQFGFATHLFGNELKSLTSPNGNGIQPRGASFRISPTSTSNQHLNTDTLLNGDEPVSTLTQDFHTRLDNLLRTLVHAKPHFVRCIAPNMQDSETEFDRAHVTNQVRSLQVLETVNLMARGFPHRMRFKAFNGRYRMLATPMNILKRTDEKSVEDCELILDCYSQLAKEYFPESSTEPNNKDWAHGRKHIFLSEGARQQLEYLRIHIRTKSATKIQSVFRGYLHRKRFKINNALNKPNPNSNMNRTVAVPVLPISPAQRAETGPIIQPQIPISQANNVSNLNLMIQMQKQQQSFRSHQNRPKPISCTPPPFDASTSTGMQSDKCDYKTIQQTCSLFGLDLERPPPIPPSRPYTVIGGKKITFPQSRVMKTSFPEEESSEVFLNKGDSVIVIGNSHRRGYLVVEKHNHTVHVPFQYLELKRPI